MRLRNGEHGYGLVTKVLHWLTLLMLVVQFAVGWTLGSVEVPDRECDQPGEDRSGGETSDAEEERFDRLEDACEAEQDVLEDRADDPVGTALSDLLSGDLLDGGLGHGEWHLVLGLGVLALGLVRLLWRATTPLPPWAPGLSGAERRLEAGLEKALLALLLVVPLSGVLVARDDGLLALHVTAQVVLLAAATVHVALVLGHTVVRRDRHLQRML